MAFSGHYRGNSSSMTVSGSGTADYQLSGERLQECEFRKPDPTGDLKLVVHSGLFTGTASAPEGAIAVRATREGGRYRLETIR